ncbi:zinc-binding alcohol dehydrogenase family protein [Myxococcus sp. K15C18031901]|uniref:quinone oxidoreductase family protein n=1 Tax=Myxococcus dinghuensis TaxID=2906761 RepID=UPI0020A71866|nr:zinc-binding alcohol dehydrogenase family protein [Myxococcus dinghuensis]MCP3097718.1 zinc-binding alcohol dehydrogenase family protein [Myxococcus dinghuensis]
MKAAILEVLGQTPRFGDFDEPTAEAGEALVTVEAASIKQLDRAIVAGTHYSSPRKLPVVCGTDGTGRLADGTRVYFSTHRRPFGAMAQRAPATWTVPMPEGLDPALAAAIVNPGLAAWLPLLWRGHLRPGESVLVLGATGASGRLAVRAARLLGAGRVVAAGRRQDVLRTLGADATIDLRLGRTELQQAFAAEAAKGLSIVVDYVWGPATEALISALVKSDLGTEDTPGEGTRIVSVGAMAAPDITLPSAALRGSRLSLIGSGTANFPPVDQMKPMVADILARTARDELSLEVDRAPLSSVGEVWARSDDPDRRLVLTP